MIICNIRKMDDAYTEKNYINEWKRKRNDYTIKYNKDEQKYGDENSEYEKERRVLCILQRKIIHDMKLL